MLFFGKFYVTKKSKSVEIVFGISKTMSGSIAMKIRQPFLWTDSYLHCLFFIHAVLVVFLIIFGLIDVQGIVCTPLFDEHVCCFAVFDIKLQI